VKLNLDCHTLAATTCDSAVLYGTAVTITTTDLIATALCLASVSCAVIHTHNTSAQSAVSSPLLCASPSISTRSSNRLPAKQGDRRSRSAIFQVTCLSSVLFDDVSSHIDRHLSRSCTLSLRMLLHLISNCISSLSL